MPHQCIECGRTFPDGSKDMLSGCPDCGGNKFQFQPSSQQSDPTTPSSDRRRSTEPSTELTEPTSGKDSSASHAEAGPGPDTDPVSDSISGDDSSSDDTTVSEDVVDATNTAIDRKADPQRANDEGSEDAAQASARSDVVSRDELERAARDATETHPSDDPGARHNVPDDPRPDGPRSDGPRPDVDELRDELNEQFESIRIVSPGQYELNLMELYDRQEYIISLQEDGRYVIEMPDAWGVED